VQLVLITKDKNVVLAFNLLNVNIITIIIIIK